MTISSRTWTTRWLPKRQPRKKRRARLLAACLVVGLATAWCPPAAEAVTVNLSVTPTENLSHAYALYYIVNSCAFWFATAVALGNLPGGQTSSFTHDFPNYNLFDDPNGPYYGQTTPGYAIVGLHGTENEYGVTIGFKNDDPVQTGATWESLVQPNLYNYAEETIVAGLLGNLSGTPEDYARTLAHSPMRPLIQLPFGSPATLVSFTDATLAGTATATVPEPGALVLAVTGTGVLLMLARRRAG